MIVIQMDQSVADGLTASIKYHPRIAKVLLDKEKVKEIEEYYKNVLMMGLQKKMSKQVKSDEFNGNDYW
ncbi:MAG: hypothetical protein ACLTTH_13250 [Holdemanella porci]